MTLIEWTHRPGTRGESWNPIRARNLATSGVGHFCEHVSEGCRNCYAERMQAHRFKNPIRYAAQDRGKVEIFLDEKVLTKPLRWPKPRTVFVSSMTDLFGEWVPEPWIDRIFAVMALCSRHTFIVLTKRPERMREYMAGIRGWPLPNLWLGVSVEHRAARGRIDVLRATPCAIRFLSLEPLLEQLGVLDFRGIHWVIVGGESGAKARPMHPNWARWIRDQCAAARVPFFFKQWGAWAPNETSPYRMIMSIGGVVDIPDHSAANEDAGEVEMAQIGKKRAAALLDGREHREWPI